MFVSKQTCSKTSSTSSIRHFLVYYSTRNRKKSCIAKLTTVIFLFRHLVFDTLNALIILTMNFKIWFPISLEMTWRPPPSTLCRSMHVCRMDMCVMCHYRVFMDHWAKRICLAHYCNAVYGNHPMVKMHRAYCLVQMPSYRRPARKSGLVAQCVQGDGLAT